MLFSPQSNTWGEGQLLAEEAHQSRDASAYFDRDGKLRVAYLVTQMFRYAEPIIIDRVEHS